MKDRVNTAIAAAIDDARDGFVEGCTGQLMDRIGR